MKRFTRGWWIQVGDRMVRTAAQSAIGAMAGCAAIDEVNGKMVLSIVTLSTLTSFLMALAGLPETEVEKNEEEEIE